MRHRIKYIIRSLLEWFAPILVFTTDEIYSLINKEKENIHEHLFVKVPKSWENKELSEKWEKLFFIKQEANVAIEEKRSSKEIGSSLEAAVKLTVDKEKFELLKNLDLAEYLITSKENRLLNNTTIKIEVYKAKETNAQDAENLEQNCIRGSNLI